MKLNVYFRANESAKSAGSINKDITKESYRISNHTKEDILKTTKEDREALQESIQFLETMKKQWEETTNKKVDITYN